MKTIRQKKVIGIYVEGLEFPKEGYISIDFHSNGSVYDYYHDKHYAAHEAFYWVQADKSDDGDPNEQLVDFDQLKKK